LGRIRFAREAVRETNPGITNHQVTKRCDPTLALQTGNSLIRRSPDSILQFGPNRQLRAIQLGPRLRLMFDTYKIIDFATSTGPRMFDRYKVIGLRENRAAPASERAGWVIS
jgi:hypothetical protein